MSDVGIPRILIRGGRVYDHDGDVHQPAVADILIGGGGSSASRPTSPAEAGAEIIDAAGKLVVPGFVNAHYHSHDVMAKGLFEEMPFDIWTLHSNPGNYGPRSQRGGAAAHADRRGRDAAQRHHHGPGFPHARAAGRGHRRHRALGLRRGRHPRRVRGRGARPRRARHRAVHAQGPAGGDPQAHRGSDRTAQGASSTSSPARSSGSA